MVDVPLRRLAFLSMMAGALSSQTYTAVVAGSGYQQPPIIYVAPGEIATFFVGGLPQTAAVLAKLVAVISTPNLTESAQVLSAKVVDTETLAISVQFPFTGLPAASDRNQWFIGSFPFTIQFAETSNAAGNLCDEGACTAPLTIDATPAAPHLINMCDLFVSNQPDSVNCPFAVTHQPGALVTSASPALPGEIVTAWAVGLGTPSGGIPVGATGPIPMNDITIVISFAVTIPAGDGTSSGIFYPPSSSYLWAGLPVPSQGLYQINFAIPPVPPGLSACTPATGNLYLGLGRLILSTEFAGAFESFNSGSICVSAS